MSGRRQRHGELGDGRWSEADIEADLAHDPLALMRGCLLRATSWSALVGLVLGAGASLFSMTRGYSVSVLITATSWISVVAFLAATSTMVIGMALGALAGLVMSVVTLVVFVPHYPGRRARHILSAIAAAIGVGGVWSYLWLVTSSDTPLRFELGDTLLSLAGAGLGGWWVGTRVAWWLTDVVGWEH